MCILPALIYQSPYIGRRIDIFCADMEDPYSVPIDMLRQCPKISSLLETSLWSDKVYLEDISETVGHVIVHFLHTGIYQCLQPGEFSSREKQIVELRISVRVYVAARAYGLPVLAKLASLETEILSDDLDFSTILEVLEETYPRPSVDDAWISEYLKSRIGVLLSQPGAFCVGDKYKQSTTSIAQICVQSVMDISQAKPTPHGFEEDPAKADQNNATPAMDPVEPIPSPIIDHCVASEHYVADIADNPLEDHAVLESRVYQSNESSVVEAAEYPEAVPLAPEKEACPSADYSVPEEARAEDFPAPQEEEHLCAVPPIADEGYPEESVLAGGQYGEHAFPESPGTGVDEYPPTESPIREVEEFPVEEFPVFKSGDYPLAEPSVPDMIEELPFEEPTPVKSAVLMHEAYEGPVIYEEVPETTFDINPVDGALVAEDPNHETTSSIEDSPLCVHGKKGKRCFKCKKARKSFRESMTWD